MANLFQELQTLAGNPEEMERKVEELAQQVAPPPVESITQAAQQLQQRLLPQQPVASGQPLQPATPLPTPDQGFGAAINPALGMPTGPGMPQLPFAPSVPTADFGQLVRGS